MPGHGRDGVGVVRAAARRRSSAPIRNPSTSRFSHATSFSTAVPLRTGVTTSTWAARARSAGVECESTRALPRVVYSWQEETPEDAILGALRRRAACVGYLGSSDSPVRVRVTTGTVPWLAAADAFVPDREGDMVINVTQPGDISRWDYLYEQWTVRGASVSRSQSPALTHPSRYRSPLSDEPQDLGEVVAWLRLGAAVSGRRVSTLTSLFKEAVLSQHQRIHGPPSPVLHGHGFSGTGYELARYLALPDVGYRRSEGRIHGLALWLPPGV